MKTSIIELGGKIIVIYRTEVKKKTHIIVFVDFISQDD